jgi:hypothetical protein
VHTITPKYGVFTNERETGHLASKTLAFSLACHASPIPSYWRRQETQGKGRKNQAKTRSFCLLALPFLSDVADRSMM